MSARKMFNAGLIATAAIALSTAAVLAFSPFNIGVISDAEVYSNRTMQSQVVNHIEAGDTVKVLEIRNKWAYIQIPGQDGWVKSANLEPFL